MQKALNIEKFLREIKPHFQKWGFGISKQEYDTLCSQYGSRIINFIFPVFKPTGDVEVFFCKNNQALEEIRKDWMTIKSFLDKTVEDISFMNISIDDYYEKIALEFYSYKQFSKEDILLTYNSVEL